MPIANHDDYRAAVARAAALDAAAPGTPEAEEFRRLTSAIREWDEAHKGENANGPEEHHGALTADDLPFSGLPGNLGKLQAD